MSLKTKILILFLLGGLSLYGQSFMYSYTDPCTRELKTLTYDMSAPVVVSYYGRVRAFTYNEIQNGVFDAWINDIFSQVQTSPCQGVLTSTTTTSTTNLTTNIINTVLNLNSITAITSIGGISNNLGGTVNLGSNSNNNNNNEQNNNSNNSNSNSNNASSNSSSSNSSNGNNGSGSSNDNSNNSNPSGGGNTGENSGGSGTGGGTSGSEKEKTTPSQEEIKETKTEEQKSSSNNVSKSTSKAKTETQKPAILLTGDIVGLQKTEDGSQDARGTFSYTRVKGDGSASLGLSADYMLRAKISNVTVMRSWIGTKDNGNKHINLISSGFSMMPGSVSNTSMFIRINSLKRFTALYGAAASYGKLYQEELI